MFNATLRDFVIPAQAGIQSINKLVRSTTTSRRCPLRGFSLARWIPACAGMTN
jgi:hypothetical protein